MSRRTPQDPRSAGDMEGVQSDDEDRSWDNIALRRGEEVIEEYRASALWPTVGTFLVWLVIATLWTNVWTVVLLIVGTVSWHWGEHENRWAITNQRVLQRTGVGNKKSTSIDRTRITDVAVERPLFNPLLRRGKVKINSAGRSGDEIVMFGMADPDGVARAVSR